jgi:pyruvate,orthophosphate dikinase
LHYIFLSLKGGLDVIDICRGLPASAGVMTGILCLSVSECEDMIASGEDNIILCVKDCATEDAAVLKKVKGVITLEGSMISDVAILCRTMSIPCVTAAKDVHFGEMNNPPKGQYLHSNTAKKQFVTGDLVTIDGTHGKVYPGRIPTESAHLNPDFRKVLKWADKYRRMNVNALIEERG